MLQPSQLHMGKGVSTAINSVLRQFSGLETDADDMLVCWSCILGSMHKSSHASHGHRLVLNRCIRSYEVTLSLMVAFPWGIVMLIHLQYCTLIQNWHVTWSVQMYCRAAAVQQ